MTRIRSRLTGQDTARRGLARHTDRIRKALVAEIGDVAEAIRRDARAHLDNAGIRPVSRTGRLARSLRIQPSPGSLMARIATPLDYGTFLEFGTRRMPAYPWLGPAVARHATAFRARVIRLLRQLHGSPRP